MTNKGLFKLFLMLSAVAVHSCSDADGVGNKLQELDEAILMSDKFLSRFEERTDSLRTALNNSGNEAEKWDITSELFLEFLDWNTDSALFYLNGMYSISDGSPYIKTGNRICKALALAKEGEKEKAEAMVGTFPDSEILNLRNLLTLEKVFRCLNEEQGRMTVIDSILTQEELPADLRAFFSGERESSYNNVHPAMEFYLNAYNSGTSPRLKADAAHRIAEIHDEWQERGMVKYWLAESAINRIGTPDRNTSALYSLALILFEEKDFERASNYTHVVLENSIISHTDNDSIIYSLDTQQAINNALEYNRNSKLRIFIITACILTLMLLLILKLLVNARRDSRRLQRSRAILSETNRKLEDANLIKDNYMFRYMQLSLKYLRGVEDHRHKLRVILRDEGPEALKKALRGPSDSMTGYEEFYRIFDEIFLSLYPDFIKKVNELVLPDERFDTGAKGLNTRLRILAVIRLGLTDSGQIAKFLNCAPSSVYSYRSRIKHKATCDSDDFEYYIKSIT